MPTVTIQGPVTLQETAKALQDNLGSGYEVTTHGHGSEEALKVKQSAAATATVHLSREGDATVFHVHGGGLVISRMVNEFGIAKKVAATIKGALATIPPPAGPPPAEQAPAGQSPAGQSPTGQSPAGQSPAGQAPAGQAPAGEPSAAPPPAGQSPAGQASAGEPPAAPPPAAPPPAGEPPAAE